MPESTANGLRLLAAEPEQAMASQSSTKALLERGRNGDSAAFDRVFTRILRSLRRWAHGRLPSGARDAGDTADLLQDAAAGVWRHLDGVTLRSKGDLEAYLRQAVRNRIRDEARRVARRPEPLPLEADVAADLPSPYELAARGELFARCARFMAELEGQEREALVARFEMGYSYDQIAILLGKPSAAAARMTVNRILDRLQALIAGSRR